MRPLLRTAGLVALIAATAAGGASAFAGVDMAGFGNARCSDLVSSADGHKREAEAGYLAWAQGFLSAVNLDRASRKLPAKALGAADYPPERQFAWLLAYCRQNAGKTFGEATLELYRHLPTGQTAQ